MDDGLEECGAIAEQSEAGHSSRSLHRRHVVRQEAVGEISVSYPAVRPALMSRASLIGCLWNFAPTHPSSNANFLAPMCPSAPSVANTAPAGRQTLDKLSFADFYRSSATPAGLRSWARFEPPEAGQ